MLRTSFLSFFRENSPPPVFFFLQPIFSRSFCESTKFRFCGTHFHENIFASNSSCIVSCNAIIHSPSRNGIIAFSHNTVYWSISLARGRHYIVNQTLYSIVSDPHLLLCRSGSWSLLFSIWIRIRGEGDFNKTSQIKK